MKKFVSAALAAMMLFAIPATAQNTATGASKTETTSCTSNNKDCNQNRKCDGNRQAKGNKGSKDRQGLRANNEFEGLNLTDTQKNQLNELKAKQRTAREAQKAQAQADRHANKEKKTADRNAKKDEREAARRAYLQEVKNIIGPDNYVIYLENMYVTAPAQPKMMQKGNMNHNRQHARADKKVRSGKAQMNKKAQKTAVQLNSTEKAAVNS